MYFLKKSLLAIMALGLIGTSCTSIMDPDADVLKTNLTQLNSRPKIRPVNQSDMVVYVRYRNTSGSILDVKEQIIQNLQNSGYRIVDDVDKARFTLVADLRYVGHKTSQSYGHTIFGALIGAVAGAIIGANVGDGSDLNKVLGGAGGAVLGGIAGKAIDNRNRIITVDMVVDISIGERIEGGVSTDRQTSSTRDNNQSTANKLSSGGTEGSRSTNSYSESTQFTQREDFIYHENRFIATATKLKLTYGEAQTALSGTIAQAIADSLP